MAVANISGGIRSAAGLDIDAVLAHVQTGKRLVDFPGTEQITSDEVLEADCEVLVSAALGEVITGENVGRIKARLILEAANNPTFPEADEILHRRGATVVPDVLCNAGGVCGSFVEWAQA